MHYIYCYIILIIHFKMSLIPVHLYPSGDIFVIPDNTNNITFKWIDPLGGGSLDGPIPYGTLRPDGKPAHHGLVSKSNNGHITIEYYAHPISYH